MLTVRILGEDLVRDLRGVANANRVYGANSDDILLLWFYSIFYPELELLDGSAVDPKPFQLRTGLGHLNVVAGDRAATILSWRLPGDINVLPASIRDGHFKRRRWSTWGERKSVNTSEMHKCTNEMFFLCCKDIKSVICIYLQFTDTIGESI